MHIAYCNKVTKVTNPISDFTFLSTAKSGKSRIKNPFLDSPKGTHPEFHPQMKHLEVCQNTPLRRKENLLKIIGTHGFGL